MNKQNIITCALVTVFILFLAIALLPCFLHSLTPDDLNFYTKTGTIGDTFGGILGPIIGLIGAVLTFLAFYIQYEANEVQKDEIAKQRESWKIERFESRFFELVRLHKENVNEMELAADIKGRRCFEHLFSEFETIFFEVSKAIGARRRKEKKEFREFQLLRVVYSIFFHGLGSIPTGNSLLKEPLAEFNLEIAEDVEGMLENDPEGSIPYQKFKGHSNSLGHYYRHLLQTVKFVINHPDIQTQVKQEYINVLRAQLSTYEQLMLYVNAISWFPDQWHAAFIEFKLIRNLPYELIEGSLDPEFWPVIVYNKELLELAEKGEILYANQPTIEDIKSYSNYKAEHKF